MSENIEDISQTVSKLLSSTIENGASDLHISASNPPTMRVNGELTKMKGWPEINSFKTREIAMEMMTEKQRSEFLENNEIDFSYNFQDFARFRVNVFFQRGSVSCSLRLIPQEIKSIDELGLPTILNKLTEATQGLVLITGPSSHGKSTTLAALIDRINKHFFKRIITIEDPIEYVFKNEKSIIDQREVYQDTSSFKKALKSSFRQDPDVIMVGEMRDPETVGTAITAAETGHLVFSTLHTNSASESVHRVIDSFPPGQQNQVRAQLAAALSGIVSQRLLRRKEGGLVVACEVMLANEATRNIIRENRTHELDNVIRTSSGEGMINLDTSLMHLVKKGEVAKEVAVMYSKRPDELRKNIEGED